jgi:hypothetical protein
LEKKKHWNQVSGPLSTFFLSVEMMVLVIVFTNSVPGGLLVPEQWDV